MSKYWWYLVEVRPVTFRKSKASENLGVSWVQPGVYRWLLFDVLWGSIDGVICTRRGGTSRSTSAGTVAPRGLGGKDRDRREERGGVPLVRASRRRLLARRIGSRHYPRIRLHLL